MSNLRELAEKGLGLSLEGGWSLPAVLIGPDGTVYEKNNRGENLTGQVLSSSIMFDPDTGAQVVVPKPVVVLRVSSLQRVPLEGEKWGVKIPTTPSTTASLEDFFMERPPETSAIGFIRLYLARVEAT